MKTFLKYRFTTILIPYIIVNLVYFLLKTVLGYPIISFQEIIGYLTHGDTYVPYTWYVFSIIFLYLLFYISFRWLNWKKGTILFIILNVTYSIITYLIGWRNSYYDTAMAFSIGILYAWKKDQIYIFLKKQPIIKFFLFGIGFIVCTFLAKKIDTSILTIIIKSVRGAFFIFIMLYISMLLKKEIKFLICLGNISYELYIYQGCAFLILQYLNLDGIHSILYSFFVLLISIIFALVFHKVDFYLLNKIKKSK